jgi:hypothetical protein
MTVFLDFWDSRGFLTYSSCLANIPILSWSTFVPKKKISRRPLSRRPLSHRLLSRRPLSRRPLSHQSKVQNEQP